MERLSLNQLCEGMQVIRQTAVSLLEDAKILLENERYPRAFMLAYTAGEELGKITILYGAFARIKLGLPLAWRRVRKSFRDHDEKARNFAFDDFSRIARPINRELSIEELVSLFEISNAAARELPKARMQALYCAFENGRFTAPEEMITEADARAFVVKADNTLKETGITIGVNPEETMDRLCRPESIAIMKAVFLDPRSVRDEAK